jgi:DHA3 family macrolide efflux protein-like MFS transporter
MTAELAAEVPPPSGLRTYYTLLITQAVSSLGRYISGFAVSIWLFKQTGHATPLALVGFFFAVPQILAGGLAGAIADRFDRRLVMLIANLGMASTSTLLLISFMSGSFAVWHLYAITVVQASFGALQGPAFLAATTMLVPDAHRDRANAIQLVAGPAAGVIGPTVAGLLYAAIGVVGSIVADIAAFLIGAVVLTFLSFPHPKQSEEGRALDGRIWKQMFSGIRHLSSRPALLALVGYFSLVNLVIVTCTALMAAYGLARTGSAAAMGLVFGAFNAGSVAGGLLMTAWGGTRPRIHGIMIPLILEGLFLAFAGMAQTTWLLASTLFGFGLAFPIVNASFLSIFQAKIAPDVQGRVFASIIQVSMLMAPISYLAAGPLADRVFEPARNADWWTLVAPLVGAGHGAGMGLLFVIAGVLLTALTVAVYAAPIIRHLEARLPNHAA